jgi:hypothetical protein
MMEGLVYVPVLESYIGTANCMGFVELGCPNAQVLVIGLY